MNGLQTLLTSSLGQTVSATVETETSPEWLLRPGLTECAAAWPAVSRIYTQLTRLTLPLKAPSRERRRLDIVLTYADGDRQILEVDERQHFTAVRATTLEHYPPGTPLGFDYAAWLTRSRALAGREPGGGFATPRPPLLPGAGGRHRQRAFRDALADLLAPEHGWRPTIRISDREINDATAQPDPATALKALITKHVPTRWTISSQPTAAEHAILTAPLHLRET